MFLSPQKSENLLKTLVEFAYAEYGSALEMLAAAKKSKSPKLKLVYIRHALDEYRHTFLLHEVLSNQVKQGRGKFQREYKFSPQNVILKGYLDKDSYLVEKFPLKKFVEFVYSNEYLSKESFEWLTKRVKDNASLKTINSIMKDELNHADDSVKFYEKSFPKAKLQVAFKREMLKNKMRLFYYKNLKFLNKIFDPLLNFLITCFGKIVVLVSIPKSDKKNLLSINSKSVV